MTNPKGEFQRDKFLLLMLASIFAIQAGVFVFGVTKCLSLDGGLRNCPDLGRRYDQTFGVMVATTLALLTGAQMTKASIRRPSLDDHDDASASPLPLQLQQPSPRQFSASDPPRSGQEPLASRQEPPQSSRKPNSQS